MLGEVHDAVAALGLALAFNYPANRNLTLCGLMGTGAYGSSLDVVSVPADAVLSVDVVDATGALRTFEMTDSDPTFLQALRTSIGVLGVIVRYTLPLRDAFKLEMNVLTVSDRLLLEPGFSSELVPLLRNGTYSSFGWYPRAGVLIIEHGRAVPANTPGEGRAITFNPDPNFVQLFSAINQWLIANPEFGPIVEYFVAQSQRYAVCVPRRAGPGLLHSGLSHSSSDVDLFLMTGQTLACHRIMRMRMVPYRPMSPVGRNTSWLGSAMRSVHGSTVCVCFH